jgi:16S rRNA (guanine527-N7)-methyltransferase
LESDEALKGLVRSYGLDEKGEAAERLLRYLHLLEKWNKRINLTASTAWPEIGVLFEEALWASRYFPEKAAGHLDIGSGAGFPAIPIHIVKPAMRLEMLESRVKRAVFLESAVATLQLPRAKVVCQRGEAYFRHEAPVEFDVISWKAIKLSNDLIGLLMRASRQETRFWLFHGDDLPVADPEAFERRTILLMRKDFPVRTGWRLSVYEKRH